MVRYTQTHFKHRLTFMTLAFNTALKKNLIEHPSCQQIYKHPCNYLTNLSSLFPSPRCTQLLAGWRAILCNKSEPNTNEMNRAVYTATLVACKWPRVVTEEGHFGILAGAVRKKVKQSQKRQMVSFTRALPKQVVVAVKGGSRAAVPKGSMT